MTRPRPHAADHMSLIGLPERVARALRIGAFGWAFLAIVGLVVATRLGWVHHRPGGDAYEIQQRQVFLIAFAVGILVSWFSEVVGGTIASVASAGILVFARHQLQPVDATVVVVVFAVPGIVWILLYLHDLRPRAAVMALVVVVLAVGAGIAAAQRIYDGIFGPSHPASDLARLPESRVEWSWSGGVTSTSADVVAEVDHDVAAVRLAVERDASLADPRWVDAAGFADDIARFSIDGLVPATEYHYAVELDGVLETASIGRFRTFPDGPASFTLAVGSCARVGSNGAVFDAIRGHDPLLFVLDGDFHYSNIATNDVDKFVDAYREQLTQNAQAALYRSTPIAYVWDDHDFGADDSDRSSPSRPAAGAAYRQVVPHYPLAGDESPIQQAFTIGRARVIMTDVRSARSPADEPDDADKTMLGAAQLDWLERELLAADEAFPVIVWVNPVPWISAAAPGADGWGSYATERARIADFVVEHGIDGLVMVSGDAHMVAIDDGTNSDYSIAGADGFPVLHAAALDRPGSVKGGPYSEGTFPGGGQFGLVRVVDVGGDTISLELEGRTWEDELLVSYEVTIPVVAEER